MAIIDLTYAFRISAEKHRAYKQAGIEFTNYTPEGYCRVSADLSTLDASEKLSHLPLDDLQDLLSLFPDSELKPGLDRAISLSILRRMADKEPDGFPAASNFRPFTWASTNHLVPEDVKRLDEYLRSLGVEQTRVGMELEFTIPEDPVEGFEHWKIVKQGILEDIDNQIASLGNPEKLHRKKAEIWLYKPNCILNSMKSIKKVLIDEKGNRHYWSSGDLQTDLGILKEEDIKNAFGKIKSHLKKEFIIFDANFVDKLEKLKRGPAIITKKDIALNPNIIFVGLK